MEAHLIARPVKEWLRRMDWRFDMLTINETRLLQDLRSLSEIGRTSDGGVSRPAMSSADLEGREWFRCRAELADLEFHQDGAGNLSAILRANDASAPTLLVGSHLDTVPDGGRFDGVLGVLSALEALRTIREANLDLPVHLEAISFTDEEGNILGLLGSRAIAGQLSSEDMDQARGGQEKLAAGMRRLGITRTSVLAARRNPKELIAFVELHVEQGTRLKDVGIDIGVVTAVVGIRTHWLHFVGKAAHAGTTPMDKRADAFWGTAAFVQRAKDMVRTRFPPGVVNFGRVDLQPGAFNIVPAEARLAVEHRHSTENQLDEMEQALLGLSKEVAREYYLTVEMEPAGRINSAPMDERIIRAIEKAATKLKLTHMGLTSFAGHDTQAVSTITPSAMFFVPSVNGISHNPREFTSEEDVVNGANTLLHTLLELATDADGNVSQGRIRN